MTIEQLNKICERCGTIGCEKIDKPGSTAVQVTLFVLAILTLGAFFFAWLPYVIWRTVKTKRICPACGAENKMVALQSPLGQRLKKEFLTVGPAA